jgi:hypothetical protein
MVVRSPSRCLSLALMAVVIALAALLACVLQVRPPMLELLTNSDSLLPADLVWGTLRHPETWQSFQWPRIPSLVPDLLVYAPLQAAFGWRVAQFFYAAASLVGLTLLAGVIAADRTTPPRPGAIGMGALGFLAAAALVFLGEWAFTTTAWHLHLMAPAYHSGPFVLSVATLVLARRTDRISLILMVAAAALGAFSDRMFVGTFLLPLGAAIAMQVRRRELRWRPAVRLLGLAALGCGLGLVADRVVFPEFLTRQADVPLNLMGALHHAGDFLSERSGWFVIGLNACLLLPLWRGWIRPQARFWWTVGTVAAGLSSLLAAALWEQDPSQRYLGAVLWWPLILWAPMLLARAGRLAVPAGVALVLAPIAAFGLAVPQGPSVLSWRDDLAACVARTGRSRGLADYWHARRITVASDWRMLVMQVRESGGTMIWGNQPAWFTSDPDAPGRPPDFNFVVMAGLDAAAIGEAYGLPDQVLGCPGSEVWLYNDAARLRRGLAVASPALVPRGGGICVGPERLSRKGGALPRGALDVTADRATSRPVTWGPNLDLHPGRWRVALRYRLRTDTPGADNWRVNGQWGTLHLARTTLPPTLSDAPGESVTEVTLNREIEAVEVPTYLAGNARLEILSACFAPIDPGG